MQIRKRIVIFVSINLKGNIMEENKKKPLNEEDLEQATGGLCITSGLINMDVACILCQYCGESFWSPLELKEHEANCPKNSTNRNKAG